jgi:putative DNA primase/helicase
MFTRLKPEGTHQIDLSTDVGSANAFAGTYKDRLIYCNDQWYRKRNQVYEAVSPEAVQGLAKTFLQEQCAKSGSWAAMKSCLSRARINATVELSRADLEVDRRLVDSDAQLVGCGDGSIVDLGTGTQCADNKNQFVTRTLGAYLDTNAACPTWNIFLSKIFDGDTEIIGFLRRAVGYSLTGLTTEQCMFILNGSGANGKTTLLTVLHHLFGNYAATIPMQTLMNTGISSQQTNDLAYLVGKRFVTASEGEDGQRLAESKIKLMTGGDRISCRRLYQDYFEFDPHFKLWLATNDLPSISGTGEAIWRRIIVIPFNVTIPPEDRDKTLVARLLKELPGILGWVLQGLTEWKQERLNPPAQVLNAGGAYRKDNDTVGRWIEEVCVADRSRKTDMRELYASYEGWCDTNGLKATSNVNLGKELTRRGFQSIKERFGNARIGIALQEAMKPLPWMKTA